MCVNRFRAGSTGPVRVNAGAPAGSHEEVAVSGNQGQRDDVTGTDDLTRIEAIGPRRAARLNDAGIRTYAGLASRSTDEIATVLPDVSPAKIDAWRDEARELAHAASTRKAADAPAGPDVPAGPHVLARPDRAAGTNGSAADGQRYESILVRILLNEDGSIRGVTAQHIRTGTERHWPTLDALPGFIEAAIASAAPPAKTPMEGPAGQTRHERPRPAEAHSAPAEAQRARPASSAVLSVERTPLRAAEPFTLTMAIELAEPASHADRLAYSAVVVAMPLTGGQKQTVARSDGVLAATSSTISITAAGLSPGAYRLDGAVSLREPGADRAVDLAGMTEGLLVQVLAG
jgi:predicted flap endonuclease-1-like 5' DNA nuclease